MPLARPLSIRWWLGSLVAGVALPALILLVWISVSQVRREQAEAGRSALSVARATATRLRDLHAESMGLLALVAARPGISDRASCASVAGAVDYLPRYADLLVFDQGGSLVCSGNSLPENVEASAAARAWISAALHSSALRPNAPQIRSFGGKTLLILSARLRNGQGTVVLLELVDALGREALLPNAVVTIVDREGAVVARSTGADWNGRSIRSLPISKLLASRPEGTGKAQGLDGVSRLYGFTTIPELGWHVYAGVPTETYVEPVREMLINGAVGTAGIFLIILVISFVLSKRIGRPLEALMTAVLTTDTGAYGRVDHPKGPLEIATLAGAFNRLVDRREESDERMRSGEQKLKALSERLLMAQEEERTRIARELHDDLGQSLTALKMDVVGLLQAMPPPPELDAIRDRILHTLDATVASVQQISSELRPSVLDDLGLFAAMEAEARLFTERSGIECEVSVVGDGPIDREATTAIYRIFQEALTNVARHSNATRTEVRLRHRAEDLLLEIRDDGRGVTEEEIADPLSIGLIGIRERADLIGGTVEFQGVAGRGTIVSVRLPTARKGGSE
jgi:signal transduction histidine kinase